MQQTMSLLEKIKHICKSHIRTGADQLVADLQVLIAGTTDSVLAEIELERDSVSRLLQRDDYKTAAENAGMDLYPMWDEFVVTSRSEFETYLESRGLKLNYDGAWHIVDERKIGYEGLHYDAAEFEEVLALWIGEQDFVRTYPDEVDAWRDACNRFSIQPVPRKPARFFIVTESLAEALEREGEIISNEIMGYHIWGCLQDVNHFDQFAQMDVFKCIARDTKTSAKLV